MSYWTHIQKILNILNYMDKIKNKRICIDENQRHRVQIND